MSEEVLDEENWKIEAQAVINDIKSHVKQIIISDKIKSTNQKIVLNLTTLEDELFCIELSGFGFRVLGKGYDSSNNNGEYFETPYSLLNSLSPLFQQSFGNELLKKLNDL